MARTAPYVGDPGGGSSEVLGELPVHERLAHHASEGGVMGQESFRQLRVGVAHPQILMNMPHWSRVQPDPSI